MSRRPECPAFIQKPAFWALALAFALLLLVPGWLCLRFLSARRAVLALQADQIEVQNAAADRHLENLLETRRSLEARRAVLDDHPSQFTPEETFARLGQAARPEGVQLAGSPAEPVLHGPPGSAASLVKRFFSDPRMPMPLSISETVADGASEVRLRFKAADGPSRAPAERSQP